MNYYYKKKVTISRNCENRESCQLLNESHIYYYLNIYKFLRYSVNHLANLILTPNKKRHISD